MTIRAISLIVTLTLGLLVGSLPTEAQQAGKVNIPAQRAGLSKLPKTTSAGNLDVLRADGTEYIF